MQKKTITRSELVQTLPRQLSAITFDEFCNGREMFDENEVREIQHNAEMIALPGKHLVWGAAETAAELVRLHSLNDTYLWEWRQCWGEDGEKVRDLTIKIVGGRVSYTLMIGNARAEHEIQHLDIPAAAAKSLERNILVTIRARVSEEEKRQDSAKLYDPQTSVETLIKYMPRDLTIGQFMELMGERTSFNPLEVVDIVAAANVMVGIK